MKETVYSVENKSKKFVTYNTRWFWIFVLISQVALAVLFLLFSIRSVWGFVNDFIDDLTGLAERSLPIAFAALIVLFMLSLASLG